MKYLMILMSLITVGCANTPSQISESAIQTQVMLNIDKYGIKSVPNILDGRFEEQIFHHKSLESSSANDPNKEIKLSWEIYSIYESRENLEEVLDKFVKSSPNSEIPYIYRAAYNYGRGHRARGDKFISQTSDGQLRDMAYYYGKAREDLQKAKKINDQSLYLYILSIQINKYSRDISESIPADIAKAQSIKSDSYDLWDSIFTLSLPRWGGSHELMKDKILEVRKLYPTNPRLKDFETVVEHDKAYMLHGSNNHAAEMLYRETISSGDSYWARENLSRLISLKEGCGINRGNLAIRPFFWFANKREIRCNQLTASKT